jgi:hypothetical protein
VVSRCHSPVPLETRPSQNPHFLFPSTTDRILNGRGPNPSDRGTNCGYRESPRRDPCTGEEEEGKKGTGQSRAPPGKDSAPRFKSSAYHQSRQSTHTSYLARPTLNTPVQDIAIVAKEATFLICCATEEFIKRFGEAAMALAERDKRTTLQYKDMGTHFRSEL